MKSRAFVLLSYGTFGGAQRRFLNLFFYLNKQNPGKYFFFLTPVMFEQVKKIYPEENLGQVLLVGKDIRTIASRKLAASGTGTKNSAQRGKVFFWHNLLFYKVYFYLRSRRRNMKIFHQIHHYVQQHNIESLLGIYTGILPLYFYLEQKKTRPAILFTNMDSWFSHLSSAPQKDWFRKYDLFNFAHQKADHLDILSPFILKGLNQRGIYPDMNRLSITASSFTDYTKCVSGNKELFNIVFAGRLEEDKNPMLFLDAALVLTEKYPDVVFHIAGEGRLNDQVRSRIPDEKKGKIIYHGFHPNPSEIMATSTVFVSLQGSNNFPSQAVLEAMACGNAIVASDTGDTSMFVNEKNGYLIPLKKKALIETLEHCILHPGEAIEKGKYAFQFVRNEFSIEKASSYYTNLFGNIKARNLS
jgi:glycosyltransferase involved in cell wall biosynthesis